MEKYKRKAIFSYLKDFCHLSDENSYMEVTEWKNGEGFDISIFDAMENRIFSMTYGQFDLLKKMVKKLEQ